MNIHFSPVYMYTNNGIEHVITVIFTKPNSQSVKVYTPPSLHVYVFSPSKYK